MRQHRSAMNCCNYMLPKAEMQRGRLRQEGEHVVSGDSHKDGHTIHHEGIVPHGHIVLPLKALEKVVGVLCLYTAAETVAKDDELSATCNIQDATLWRYGEHAGHKISRHHICSCKEHIDRRVHQRHWTHNECADRRGHGESHCVLVTIRSNKVSCVWNDWMQIGLPFIANGPSKTL